MGNLGFIVIRQLKSNTWDFSWISKKGPKSKFLLKFLPLKENIFWRNLSNKKHLFKTPQQTKEETHTAFKIGLLQSHLKSSYLAFVRKEPKNLNWEVRAGILTHHHLSRQKMELGWPTAAYCWEKERGFRWKILFSYADIQIWWNLLPIRSARP